MATSNPCDRWQNTFECEYATTHFKQASSCAIPVTSALTVTKPQYSLDASYNGSCFSQLSQAKNCYFPVGPAQHLKPLMVLSELECRSGVELLPHFTHLVAAVDFTIAIGSLLDLEVGSSVILNLKTFHTLQALELLQNHFTALNAHSSNTKAETHAGRRLYGQTNPHYDFDESIDIDLGHITKELRTPKVAA